jgi:DNA-binding transcriptional MerR regulator
MMVVGIEVMPPRGHYLAHEVGLLAGVPGHTIGQWARRGYIRSSQSEDSPRIYSFQDVAEAMVVHEALDRGVPHAEIKAAINTLRTTEPIDWPLTHAKLATYHGRIVDVHGWDIGSHTWQRVIDTENLSLIATQLNRGGWAVREIPDLIHIEVNPDRLSGRPAIRDRRIAARDVAEIAETEGGITDLRAGFELTDDEITDARRWWQVAREYEFAQAA